VYHYIPHLASTGATVSVRLYSDANNGTNTIDNSQLTPYKHHINMRLRSLLFGLPCRHEITAEIIRKYRPACSHCQPTMQINRPTGMQPLDNDDEFNANVSALSLRTEYL